MVSFPVVCGVSGGFRKGASGGVGQLAMRPVRKAISGGARLLEAVHDERSVEDEGPSGGPAAQQHHPSGTLPAFERRTSPPPSARRRARPLRPDLALGAESPSPSIT